MHHRQHRLIAITIALSIAVTVATNSTISSAENFS
jgi:hypothetical protein